MKKIISISLGIFIIFTALFFTPVTASALTSAEAVNWAVSRIGSQSYQCVVFTQLFCQQYFSYAYPNWQCNGTAKGPADYISSAYPLPNGFQRIYKSDSNFSVKAGDLVVFSTPAPYGHIGIAENSSTMIDANGGSDWNLYAGTPPARHTINYTNLACVLRPPYEGTNPFADGQFIHLTDDNTMWRMAGGAATYVTDWANVGGQKPFTEVSRAQFNALRQYPADGTLVGISMNGTGGIYVFAGGAPIWVSDWSVYGGEKPYVLVDGKALTPTNYNYPFNHVRPYPADGTFIGARNTNNIFGVYVFAGGAPIWVPSWDIYGGEKLLYALTEERALRAFNDPYNHIRRYPVDGTLLRAAPSGRVFRVVYGRPYYISSWDHLGGEKPTVTVSDWVLNNHTEYLNHNPYGDVDAAIGGNGTITVRGWAWDGNAVDQSVAIHVYIGGPSGGGGQHIATITANKERRDVNTAFPGIGNYHGFEETIPTSRRGQQQVYLYAINIGVGNENPLLRNCPKTVTIAEPIVTTTSAPITTTALTTIPDITTTPPITTTSSPSTYPPTTTKPTPAQTVIMRIDGLYAAVHGAKVKVNDAQDLTPIFNTGGRTMVPFRFIATCFGAEVDWDENLGSVIIDHNGKHIAIPINMPYAIVDGVQTEINAPAEIMTEYNRTFVPFRAVAQLLNIAVDYDFDTMTIIASENEIDLPKCVRDYEDLMKS